MNDTNEQSESHAQKRARLLESKRQYHRNNLDKDRAYRRKWRAENKDKVIAQKKRYRIKHAKRLAEYYKDYLVKNRVKHKARSLLSRRVQQGKIEKLPCEVCGTQEKIDGHHDDYSKPLEVRWLCKKHHYKVHNP